MPRRKEPIAISLYVQLRPSFDLVVAKGTKKRTMMMMVILLMTQLLLQYQLIHRLRRLKQLLFQMLMQIPLMIREIL